MFFILKKKSSKSGNKVNLSLFFFEKRQANFVLIYTFGWLGFVSIISSWQYTDPTVGFFSCGGPTLPHGRASTGLQEKHMK